MENQFKLNSCSSKPRKQNNFKTRSTEALDKISAAFPVFKLFQTIFLFFLRYVIVPLNSFIYTLKRFVFFDTKSRQFVMLLSCMEVLTKISAVLFVISNVFECKNILNVHLSFILLSNCSIHLMISKHWSRFSVSACSLHVLPVVSNFLTAKSVCNINLCDFIQLYFVCFYGAYLKVFADIQAATDEMWWWIISRSARGPVTVVWVFGSLWFWLNRNVVRHKTLNHRQHSLIYHSVTPVSHQPLGLICRGSGSSKPAVQQPINQSMKLISHFSSKAVQTNLHHKNIRKYKIIKNWSVTFCQDRPTSEWWLMFHL